MAIHYRYPDNYMREGIDTITIRISYYWIVNPQKWYWHSRMGEVSFRKELSQYKNYYYIDFQEEFFEPNSNRLTKILIFISNLFVKNILQFDANYFIITNIYQVYFFIMEHHLMYHIFELYQVDFHFDFSALEKEPKGMYDTSTYSPDHRDVKASDVIRYDRRFRMLQRKKITNKEGMAYKKVMAMPYPKRIEFRFIKGINIPTSRMRLQSINGDFNQIFMRYAWYMAKRYKKYKDGLGIPYADFDMPSWNYLMSFLNQSSIHNSQRYKHTRLI